MDTRRGRARVRRLPCAPPPRARVAWAAGALLCLASTARADVQLGTVEVDAARVAADRDRGAANLEDVSFVTVIDAHAPGARGASVADLLEGARTAGVQLRSRGGLGAFTSISLRGSDSNEVAVLIDGVPLSRAGAGVIDLSQLAADGLDRIEIYRGVPPLELGAEAIGGAINLVTARGSAVPRLRLESGLGSFGARSASAGWSSGGRRVRGTASLAYHGATGDFTYYDDRGTLFDASDDRIAVRQNNGFDQLALDAQVGTVGRTNGRLGWKLATHGFWKRQGVPGQAGAGAESLLSRLTTGRLLAEAELNRPGRRLDWSVRGHVLSERYLFVNPRGERVGPYGPAATDSDALAAGLFGRLDAPLGRYNFLTVLGELRLERRVPHDLLLLSRSGLPSYRVIGGVGVTDELRLLRDRLVVSGALRLDGIASLLGDDPTQTGAVTSLLVSPRLLVRGRVTRWLTLRGGAGRFVRLPTLLEQFGDGAFILGARQLKPETAWGGDAGLAARTTVGSRVPVELGLEAAFFGRRVSDFLTFVPAANAYSATNLGDVQVLGAELRALLHIGPWVQLSLDYTRTESMNFTREPGVEGKQLPGRPRNALYGRLDGRIGPVAAFYELDWVDDTFRDAQNYNVIPGRVLHALGLTLAHGAWALSLEVRNLADLRVVTLPLGGSARRGESAPSPLVDFFDYPLPGRALYATLRFVPPLPSKEPR